MAPSKTRRKGPGATRLASAEFVGHIDSVDGGTVIGWAFSRTSPADHLQVQVLVDGQPAATLTADIFRTDLLHAGASDGYCGFTGKLPTQLLDGRSHSVQIVESNTKTPIGSMLDNVVLDRAGIEGGIDSLSDGIITGWALSRERPLERLLVQIIVDGQLASAAVADQPRSDLSGYDGGDGRHGFSTVLPTYLLDGKTHSLQVIEAESRISLLGGSDAVILTEAVKQGASERHNLYLLFDNSFYAEQIGDVEDGLSHYTQFGWREGLNPHPLFDTEYYVALYGPQLGEQDPLTHFFYVGRWNNHHTHPLFDPDGYARQRPDVAQSNLHPLLHYLNEGWKEGVRVSRFFDEGYYKAANAGVEEAGFIPLVHYLRFGWQEGRRPHPDFAPDIFARMANLPKHREPFTEFTRDALTRQISAVDPTAPKTLSIVILNLNKSLMTLQCLYFLRAYTHLSTVEVLIVDNGSAPDRFSMLCELAGDTRIIRLGANRGFGEGNNIAVDEARGTYLLFLNNDAFATPGWLPPLLAVLDTDPTVGAAGPKFLYPDGRLQEAGAMVAPDGTALQRGKHMDGSFPLFDNNGPSPVDYCSAAALVIRTESFRRILGYDLCWDPAYYEDADLCLKLRLIGQKTMYVPASKVVHIENGTSSDQQLDLRLHDVVAVNRLKFVSRWSRFLAGTSDGAEESLLTPVVPAKPRPRSLPRLGIYSPYPMVPGGGERYLLTIASALRDRFDCTLLTPDRYSSVRLATMARELELDLDHVELTRIGEATAKAPFAVFITMGNEIFPSIHGAGALNLYHCQFPFPLHGDHYASHWDKLDSYSGYIVNSEFTSHHVERAERRLGIAPKPRHVVNPPVPQIAPGAEAFRGDDQPGVILNVGRFAPGGHCKRQDIMIEAFRGLVSRSSRPLELHLAGSLGGESAARGYLTSLQQSARGLPVFFHVNVMPAQIHSLYRKASVYWHLTGIGSNVDTHPEVFEHFGITIGEAMSAGAIPVVLRHGGPAEIITDGWNGFLIANVEELLGRTMAVLHRNSNELAAVRTRAQERARQFSVSNFGDRLLELVGGKQPVARVA